MVEILAEIGGHRTYRLEMFDVPCDAEFYFYGSWGEQARVQRVEGGGIAVECAPEDRPAVLKVFKDLVALMEKAEKT